MASTLEVLHRLQLEKANNQCLDCGAGNPQWVSINHATFICLDCSVHHRALGVAISLVRSVSMDAWSEGQLRVMALGGNQRLWDFFEAYHLNGPVPHAYKYTTVAARYYRDLLRARAENEVLPNPPPRSEEGQQSVVERYEPAPRPSVPVYDSLPADLTSLLPDDHPKTWWDSAKHAYNRLPELGVASKLVSAAGYLYSQTVVIGGTAITYMVSTTQPGAVRSVAGRLRGWTLGLFAKFRRTDGLLEPLTANETVYLEMQDRGEPRYVSM